MKTTETPARHPAAATVSTSAPRLPMETWPRSSGDESCRSSRWDIAQDKVAGPAGGRFWIPTCGSGLSSWASSVLSRWRCRTAPSRRWATPRSHDWYGAPQTEHREVVPSHGEEAHRAGAGELPIGRVRRGYVAGRNTLASIAPMSNDDLNKLSVVAARPWRRFPQDAVTSATPLHRGRAYAPNAQVSLLGTT